jgi:hypothetical protein
MVERPPPRPFVDEFGLEVEGGGHGQDTGGGSANAAAVNAAVIPNVGGGEDAMAKKPIPRAYVSRSRSSSSSSSSSSPIKSPTAG